MQASPSSWQNVLVVAGTSGAVIIGAGIWGLCRFRLPKGRSLPVGRQLLIGHRGCRLGQPVGEGPPPENTLEAFGHSLEKGADGFELDTRLTKDGVPVVFHDARVGRCLVRGEGYNAQVSELTLAEVQQLPFKQAPNVRVPTLEQALELASQRHAKVLVETKDIIHPQELAVQVVALIRKHNLLDDALVISFDPRSLYYVRRTDPEVRTCLLWIPGLVSAWNAKGTEVLPLAWRLLSPLIDVALTIGAHPALLPSFLGVSAVGPQTAFRKTHLRSAWRRGIATYLWVINNEPLRAEVRQLAGAGLFAYSTDWLWPGSVSASPL